MNFYRIAKPVRQAAALGMLVLAIAALLRLTIAPIYSHIASIEDKIYQHRMTLGRFEAIARDENTAQNLMQQTKSARAAGLFLEGESDSIRMAGLQSLMAELGQANGIKYRSVRNLPSRERNELRLMGVQLQFVANIESLRKFLVAIEEQRRVLFVSALQVSPLTGTWVSNEDQRGMLDIRFDVFGVEPRQK